MSSNRRNLLNLRSGKPRGTGPRRSARVLEVLEGRVLLAADTVSALTPLRNGANPLDVNADGRLSPMDALMIVSDLSKNGAHAVAAGSSSPTASPSATTTGSTASTTGFLDVNGDNRVSPIDALEVIHALIDPPTMEISAIVTDMTGTPISTIAVGQQFELQLVGTDITTPPAPTNEQGVFSAYENVTFNSGLASIAPTDQPTAVSPFSFTDHGDLTTAGQINHVGVIGSFTPPNSNQPEPLWTIPLTATAAGTLTFAPSFDSISGHDTLDYSSLAPLTSDQIEFVNGSVQVIGVPIITVNNVTLPEGAPATTTPFVFTVSLSAPSSDPVSVQYATAPGTATSPTNFTAVSGTLNFPAGTTTETVTVQVNGGTLTQPSETFSLVLSNPSSNALLGGSSVGLATIDRSPLISVANTQVTNVLTGNTTTATFTVTLAGASAAPVTVAYATASGTALAGTDYLPVNGILTFTPGTVSQTVPVTIIGNSAPTGDKTFVLNLSSPTVGVLSNASQATATIHPAIALPSLSITSVGLPKANSGFVNYVFTVTLSNPTTQTVTATFTTQDDTAKAANNDYIAESGTLTFDPGVTTQTITVPVVGNSTPVPPTGLDFKVIVHPVSGAQGADAIGVGTITNAGTPTFSINNVTVAGGSGGNAVFTVMLSGTLNPNQSVSVGYATANGTAVANTDYLPVSGVLTFTQGGPATQTILVPITGNATSGPDKKFFVNLSSATSSDPSNPPAIAIAQGTATLVEQGLKISDALVTAPASGMGNAVFTVSLTQPFAQQVTVQYATSDGTATAPGDYTTTSGTVTFAPGVTSQTVTVPVVGKSQSLPDATFFVTLSNPTGGAELFSPVGTGTIVYGSGVKADVELELVDNQGNVLPASTPLTLGQAFTLKVFVQDVQGSPQGVFSAYMNLSYDAGLVSPTGGVSFDNDNVFVNGKSFGTSTPGSINGVGAFAGLSPPTSPGSPELLFSVPMVANNFGLAHIATSFDTTQGHDFTEYNSLTALQESDINFGTATAQIGTNVLAIGNATATVNSSTATSAVFTVTRFSPSNQTATVTYTTSDGTAVAGNDYVAQSGTLTFPPGVTTQTITITTLPNAIPGPDKTFSVTLSNPVNALASSTPGIGTIHNTDAPVGVSVANATTSAGQNMQFVVSLGSPSGFPVTVHYATADGTAKAGIAYQGTSGDITFPAGVTQETVTVATLPDTTIVPNETFQLVLSNPVNATITGGTATGLIIAVPPAGISGFVYVDLNNDGIMESNETGIANVTITATQLGTGFSQSTLTTSNGSYSLLGLPPGTYTVTETQPGFYVPGEATHLGVVSPSPTQFTGVVVQSSALASGYDFGELGLRPQFTAQLFNRRALFSSSVVTGEFGATIATGGPINLTQGAAWVSFDGGWQGPRIINALFQPGAGSVTMTLFDNNLNPIAVGSPNSSGASIRFSGNTGAAYFLELTGTNPSVTLQVQESVSVGNVTQIASASGVTNFVFPVTLSGALSQAITVHYATVDGTASALAGNYDATSGTLTFNPGVLTQFVTVAVHGSTINLPSETFSVVLSNPTVVFLGNATGTGTILSSTAQAAQASAANSNNSQSSSTPSSSNTSTGNTSSTSSGTGSSSSGATSPTSLFASSATTTTTSTSAPKSAAPAATTSATDAAVSDDSEDWLTTSLFA